MTVPPAPPPSPPGRGVWAGVGWFFLVVLPLLIVAGLAVLALPAVWAVVLPLAAIGGGVLVYRRGGGRMVLGCVLAGAVTLIVAGGACVYLVAQSY